jgi:tRNA (adenine22-N1)-methyltransferase
MTTLSTRLETVLQLLEPCAVLADVGTDHGLVPVSAVHRGIAKRAIAVDLHAAPLRAARRHVERTGVADRVTLVQGDGLQPLQSRAVDAVVLAGVSGALMVRLCTVAPHVLATVAQLIVQPNQDASLVRAWALGHGWHLRDERMIEQRGRFFTVCAFAKGSGADPAYELAGWTQEELCRIGPRFLRRKDAVALRWCEKQRARLGRWVQAGIHKREPELQRWQRLCEALSRDESAPLVTPLRHRRPC